MPTAPRSICHAVTVGDLWVLACGRSRSPADEASCCTRSMLRSARTRSIRTCGVGKSLSSTVAPCRVSDGSTHSLVLSPSPPSGQACRRTSGLARGSTISPRAVRRSHHERFDKLGIQPDRSRPRNDRGVMVTQLSDVGQLRDGWPFPDTAPAGSVLSYQRQVKKSLSRERAFCPFPLQRVTTNIQPVKPVQNTLWRYSAPFP